MRARLSARTRLVLRGLLVAALVYPLTAATRGTDDSDYFYPGSSDMSGGCTTEASQPSGAWICWYPLGPDSP